MDYKKIYSSLVEKANVRGLDKSKCEGYFEIHHIIPRCLGGSDDASNLVMFTGREHFIAHMLLWKAYPDNVSLMRAAHIMSSRWVSGTIDGKAGTNSRTYSRLREEYSQAVKQQVSGEGNPFYGKKHTPESIAKMKAWHAANPEVRLSFVGFKHSEETRMKMSVSARNKPAMTEDTKKKISEALTGIQKTPEWVAKLAEANRGQKRTAEQRERMSKAQSGKPWSEAKRISMMASMKYGEDHHSYGVPKSADQKQKISQSLKSKNQRPWENPVSNNPTDQAKWALSDYYYDLWIKFDKPGLKKLKKIYDYLHDDDIALSSLAIMRINFAKGWVPSEDAQWCSFRDSYMEV